MKEQRGQARRVIQRLEVSTNRTAPGGAQQAAEEGHEQRCTHALAAHVAHQEDEAPVGQHKGVVEVPGHLARRLEVGGQLPAFELWQLCGQESLLDLTRNVQLALEALAIDLFKVVQPLLLQAGGHAGAQQSGLEGLRQKILAPSWMPRTTLAISVAAEMTITGMPRVAGLP